MIQLKKMPPKRAVITGMGVICSLGKNRQEVFENVRDGKCGIREVKSLNLHKLMTNSGGEIEIFPFGIPPDIEFKDRTVQLAYFAMREAINDSGIDIRTEDPYRCALSFGTCNGNILTIEKIYEKHYRGENLSSFNQESYLAIDYLNKLLNICGIKVVFVTACSASNNAIGYAYDLITTDQADVVFVGGSDTLSKSTFAGFNSLQSLAEQRCNPFSEGLGISLGEGAAFMIIESKEHAINRNAEIHAEVLGYGFSGDAYHATSPDVTGDGAARTMKKALESAGIDKGDIVFICAHGTGTEVNDKTESLAVKKVFAQHSDGLYISSIKSMLGHTLGAAGIIQAVISIDCMNQNLIPGNVSFTVPREGCDLNYVRNKPIAKNYDYFLSNSFAFGGNNVSIVFGKGQNNDAKKRIHPFAENGKIVVTGFGYCLPSTQRISLADLLKANNAPATENRMVRFDDFVLINPKFKKFGKVPRISQFAIQAVENTLRDANYSIKDGTEIGMIWGVAKGPLKTFEKYYKGILDDGIEFASALSFPHIVLNSIAGQASIAFGVKGCNTTVAGQFSSFAGMQYASQLIKQNVNKIFIVGGADEISKFDECEMEGENYKQEHLSEGSAVLILESAGYAQERNARAYAEIDGFSIMSSYYDKNIFESYKKCIDKTLYLTGLKEEDIDLYIPCQFSRSSIDFKNIMHDKAVANSQSVIGTLESATAILNTILGIIALKDGFAPKYGFPCELCEKNFNNILIAGAASNGTYYSFVLKRYSVR